MSKGIFSVTSDCVLNRIPRKGITSAKENSPKMVDRTLNKMFKPACPLYGKIYFTILRNSFISLKTAKLLFYYKPV
jgi:hypothetical protein